jgi:hypothetical protein
MASWDNGTRSRFSLRALWAALLWVADAVNGTLDDQEAARDSI